MHVPLRMRGDGAKGFLMPRSMSPNSLIALESQVVAQPVLIAPSTIARAADEEFF
jgi:hypothetical protein